MLINIAIDGYSGCGKSSTARRVATELEYKYIDTGAMYRAVTYYLLKHGVDISDEEEVKAALADIFIDFGREDSVSGEIFLNKESLGNQLRTPEVNQWVSQVSALPGVRRKMQEQQRAIARKKGVVMDGRDIGTVVLPEAELKIFMTADIKIRAKRRQLEMQEIGISDDVSGIIRNLEERDRIDTGRADSPLRQAPEAVVIDTSHLKFDQQVSKIVELAKEKINEYRD